MWEMYDNIQVAVGYHSWLAYPQNRIHELPFLFLGHHQFFYNAKILLHLAQVA